MEENYGKVREKIDPANYRKAAKHAFKEKTKSCITMEEDDGFDRCLFSSANYSIMGRKSQKQLTKDEKEARWLRRILANRESARQTIRRRQAMLAELTQQTADLEMVNENLKREKELASSEYNLLKNTNEHLKAQIDEEMMKKEAMAMKKRKEKEKLELQNAESFDSVSLTGPSVISNQSSSEPNWQSFPQASNGSIQMLSSENGIATLMPMWMPNVEQMNSAMIAHPGAFVYVLPVPLLYPFTAPISTQLVQTIEPNDSLVHEFGSSFPPEKMIHEANGESSLPMKSKFQAACPSNFAGQEAGSIPSGDEDDSVGIKNYVRPPFISLHEGDCSNSGDITAVTCHTEDFQTEKGEGLRIVPSNKIVTDPFVAAQARKRRKQLLKLKNLWT